MHKSPFLDALMIGGVYTFSSSVFLGLLYVNIWISYMYVAWRTNLHFYFDATSSIFSHTSQESVRRADHNTLQPNSSIVQYCDVCCDYFLLLHLDRDAVSV